LIDKKTKESQFVSQFFLSLRLEKSLKTSWHVFCQRKKK